VKPQGKLLEAKSQSRIDCDGRLRVNQYDAFFCKRNLLVRGVQACNRRSPSQIVKGTGKRPLRRTSTPNLSRAKANNELTATEETGSTIKRDTRIKRSGNSHGFKQMVEKRGITIGELRKKEQQNFAQQGWKP